MMLQRRNPGSALVPPNYLDTPGRRSDASYFVTCRRRLLGWPRTVKARLPGRGFSSFCCTTVAAQLPHVPSVHMAFLRRRFGGAPGDESPADLSREPSPGPDGKRPANLRVITAEQLQTLKSKHKHGKRKNAWVFGLGGLFGLVVAGFFASNNDLIDMKSLENMNLESIMEALPANFITSAQQLQVHIPSLPIGEERLRKRADQINPVENRARCSKLRFLRRRPTRSIAGYTGQTPRYNDSGSHFDWTGVLGHRGGVKTVLPQEIMGLVDHDARSGHG